MREQATLSIKKCTSIGEATGLQELCDVPISQPTSMAAITISSSAKVMAWAEDDEGMGGGAAGKRKLSSKQSDTAHCRNYPKPSKSALHLLEELLDALPHLLLESRIDL